MNLVSYNYILDFLLIINLFLNDHITSCIDIQLICFFLSHANYCLHCKKKRIFTEPKKVSGGEYTVRSFIGFVKRKFRTKLLVDECQKWFRTQGSVRNLYQERSKRFRMKGLVRNFYQERSKRFSTKLFQNNAQKVS